jgi:hypothetical protein
VFRENRRLNMGASQVDRPTPCPYWRAKAASLFSNPNSWALGQVVTISAVVIPGLVSSIDISKISRHFL